MTDFEDTIIRTALAPIRELTPTDDEVARVAANARHTSSRPRPRLAAVAAAVMAAVLLAATAYSVPVTRAAIEDIAGSLSPWLGGEDTAAPGQPAASDAPSWVRDTGGRLIARAGGVSLHVTRTKSRNGEMLLGFALGSGGVSTATFDTVAGWRDRFAERSVMVLGALPGRAQGAASRFPLLGVTAASVTSVRLEYAHGAPLVSERVDGGFVLMADGTRPLDTLTVHDESGRAIGRTDVSTFADPATASSP